MGAGSAWLRAGIVAAFVVALDQLTKALVRADVTVGEKNEVLPFLDIVHVHNDGVAFGFLGGGGTLVLIVVLAALALLLGFFARNATAPLLWLPTGMLLGGAVGNLIDRIHQGYVTDFIGQPILPSFNVADIAVTCGVILLLIILELNARRAPAA